MQEWIAVGVVNPIAVMPCRVCESEFRGGLVFKTRRLLYHSSVGLRVIKKKKSDFVRVCESVRECVTGCVRLCESV